MSTVLITGASGFIGRALAASMSSHHDVVCMSRKDPGLGLPFIEGEFSSFEDLRQLDARRIDVALHLAAVTGTGPERDNILVNVAGTRSLMRYLMDHGCGKFVMASSIAAVGIQNTRFRPLELPLPDEHPCLDRDGYGLSKHMMEELTKYCHRQDEAIDVINLRLSVVCPDDGMPPLLAVGPVAEWTIGHLVIMALSDAIRAFTMAAEAPHKPGVRTMNTAGPKAWAAVPVVEVLQNWWGDEVDLSYFQQPGHEYESVYDVGLIRRELGFVAELLPERG